MAYYDFIFGASGSGKSRYIYKWLSDEARLHPDKKYFLFVPEQNTLKAQREIISISEDYGMLNLDVLSFQLLFYRVIEELGITAPAVLDDIGKALLIRKAVLEVSRKEGLNVYAGKVSSKGFIEQIKSLISEFYQYNINPEKLRKLQEAAKSQLLKGKLGDIANIYEAFTGELKESRTIPEEIPLLLLKYIMRSELLKDAVIVFDGYTGFTPVQLELIGLIMPEAERLRFALTIPSEEEPYRFIKEDITDIWWLSKKNIAALIDTASKAGVSQSKNRDIRLSERKRYDEGIYIREAADPVDEIRLLAGSIRRNALENDIRYQKMAVIVSDPEAYKNIIGRELRRAEIPFFMDDKKAALGSPAIELIRAACAMITESYRYDDVMRFIKNPLNLIDGKEQRGAADELDNYLRKTGKRGRKQLEALAENVCSENLKHVFVLEEALKAGKSAADKTAALEAFAADIDITLRTEQLAKALEEKGLWKEASENRRFASLLPEFFIRISEVLGDEDISTKDYVKLIEAGFIDMKGGMIPETMDMVIIGDLKRSRLDDIDVLYIVGANDGLMPNAVTGGGIFTDRERVEMEELGGLLKDGGIELAPDDRTDSCIQEFYIRLMMNKPNRKLILSYSKNSSEQKPLKPSTVIEGLKAEAHFEYADEDNIDSKEDALELFTRLIRRGVTDDKVKMLYRKLATDEEFHKRAELVLKGAFIKYEKDALSEEVSKKLYGNILSGSVSRIEDFEKCAYRHFLDYGLRLKERESFDIEAVDIGKLFHGALDEIFRETFNAGTALIELSDAELKSVCERAVERVISEYSDNVMTVTARNRFIADRVRRITSKTAWVLREQLKKGDFKTLGTEVEFKYRDENIFFKGKIDRIDYCFDEENNKTYVKVIDYKTGSTAFDINKTLNGLQLQLTAYMDAAMKETAKLKGSIEGVAPAGMFYYNVAEPSIKLSDIRKLNSNDSDYTASEELTLKELRMNGAVLKDDTAAGHLDKEACAEGKDMKAALKSSKVMNQSTMPLSESGFSKLIASVKDRMHTDADLILAGNIDIKPYKSGTETACDYCSYKGICGFDTDIKGFGYKRIKKFTNDEINEFLSDNEEEDR